MAAPTGSPPAVSREDALAFRLARHQLDRAASTRRRDVDLLDFGVQDTGSAPATWALAARGGGPWDPADLVYAWTLRGGPHAYRRADVGAVAVATCPWSPADAGKRIFDAATPLRRAGVDPLEALGVVARALRAAVTRPTAKGDASAALAARLDEPYLRDCRPCRARHAYEQPFRIAALQAGLELVPGTSPPVLRRLPGRPNLLRSHGADAAARFDVVRAHLRFYGPARPADVAAFVETTVAEVQSRWPDDAVEVAVAGERPGGRNRRYVLAEDLDLLIGGAARVDTGQVRLLGSHDPWLQLRDRELLVADEARRKDLWRVLGRPGVVLVGREVVATWRPRSSGGRLRLEVDAWRRLTRAERDGLDDEAARLAAHRGDELTGWSLV